MNPYTIYTFLSDRRQSREPSKHSRVCSCHFRDGKKINSPEIYARNEGKLFPQRDAPRKKKRKSNEPEQQSLQVVIENAKRNEQPPQEEGHETNPRTTHEVILEAELELANKELRELEVKAEYKTKRYAVAELSDDVVRMETGLPTKEVFNIVVKHALRFKDDINYFSGWKVESHSILFDDLMTTIPSRRKNKLSAQSSFSQFGSCRIIIDCTDIENAAPGLMSQKNAIYSSYRGMKSFKVIIGVAPLMSVIYIPDPFQTRPLFSSLDW